jgi:hypothetical protein
MYRAEALVTRDLTIQMQANEIPVTDEAHTPGKVGIRTYTLARLRSTVPAVSGIPSVKPKYSETLGVGVRS